MVQDSNSKKKLSSFIKNKKCDSVGIAPLRSDGNLHGNPQTKASLINQQFSSVFTTEDTSDIPDLGGSTTLTTHGIRVTEKGVLKLLQGLNPNKATGSDEISTKFLKEMAHPVTPALTKITYHRPRSDARGLELSQCLSNIQDGRQKQAFKLTSCALDFCLL